MIFTDFSTFNWEEEAQKHQRSVFVDIDDTVLIHNDFTETPRVNHELLERLNRLHNSGIQVVLWTGMGKQRADHFIICTSYHNVFDAVLAKPHIILDDSPDWFKDTYYVNVKK